MSNKLALELEQRLDPVTNDLLQDWRFNRPAHARGKTRIVHIPSKTMERVSKHCKKNEIAMGRFTEEVLKWYLENFKI